MDVREKVTYSEDILDGMQASAERYVRLYADPLKVGVNVRSKYGPGECFYLMAARNSRFVLKNTPYFITRSQLDSLRDGCGRVYGRMEKDYRFFLLYVCFYKITFLSFDRDFTQEEIKKIVYEE